MDSQTFSTDLHARGFRLTPQRLTILEVLADAGTHLTPLEVFERAQKSLPTLTEPTVYRTLSFLAEQGFAWISQLGDGGVAYEIAAHDHHHIACKRCGQWMEIDHDLVASLYQKLEAETGYRIDSHHLTFSGLCPKCRKDEEKRR